MRRVEDQRAKTERLRVGGGLILIESPYKRVRLVTLYSSWLPSVPFSLSRPIPFTLLPRRAARLERAKSVFRRAGGNFHDGLRN